MSMFIGKSFTNSLRQTSSKITHSLRTKNNIYNIKRLYHYKPIIMNTNFNNNNNTNHHYLKQQKRSYMVDYKGREPFYPRQGKKPIECSNALEAVECIGSNNRVFIHGMAATPEILINALCQHALKNNLQNIELVHLLTAGNAPQVTGKYRKHFRDTSLFISNNIRNAVNEGIAEYVPIFLSEIPLLFLDQSYIIDAALLHVSPPDHAGFCSLGTNVDISRAGAAAATKVIGVLNKNMPRTHGDGQIHISQFDYICEHHTSLLKLTDLITTKDPKEINRISKIGTIIAENLIPDGACLQIGIGEIPQSIINNLHSHKDLGVHTEMFGDGLIHLCDKGVINGSRKVEHPGKIVASFVLGNEPTYNFVNDNPRVVLCESNYVNDPMIIASNPNFCSINSAIEIDLTGQVCSDSIGYNLYSGVGGQVDFIRGSSMSMGGKPIIAMTSTTSRGESKIVSQLRKGSGVVTTRAHVRYVVTEYGFVNLFGKNLKQRAELLISIAHPDHRDGLMEDAKKRFKHIWDPQVTPS